MRRLHNVYNVYGMYYTAPLWPMCEYQNEKHNAHWTQDAQTVELFLLDDVMSMRFAFELVKVDNCVYSYTFMSFFEFSATD